MRKPLEMRETQNSLIAAVLRGDSEAIDRWYAIEFPVAFRIAFGFLGNETEAEDVAQDAVLKMMDRMASRRPGASWVAWRSAIVVNLCRDRLRRVDARRRAEEKAPELPERLPSPVDAVEQGELRTMIAAALETLPAREREVFILHDLEQIASTDVAASLEIEASTVRSILSLARRRLRDMLSRRLQGSGDSA